MATRTPSRYGDRTPSIPAACWNPEPAALGDRNCILVASARQHSVQDYPGPLSIKTVVKGRVAWRVDRRNVWVDESSYLVLNQGEPYSMNIEAAEPVTTCVAFFAPCFVESAARVLSAADRALLDDPAGPTEPLPFLSGFYPRNTRVMEWIRQTATRSGIDQEEGFLRLAEELLLDYAVMRSQMARIESARPATRHELFRRVARGREFLHAAAFGPLTLAECARAAGMSTFHFQRTFTTAFGKSPASYVTDLRFAYAARLLRAGVPVTEVCLAVGYTSLGSFSSAFRRYYGASPRSLLPRFRKTQFRKIEEAGQQPPEIETGA